MIQSLLLMAVAWGSAGAQVRYEDILKGPGGLIWKYSDARAEKQGTNRGVGILGDRIYFTAADNYLTALDRRNGAVIWTKKFGNVSEGVGSSAPVFIAKDKILVGHSGSDS